MTGIASDAEIDAHMNARSASITANEEWQTVELHSGVHCKNFGNLGTLTVENYELVSGREEAPGGLWARELGRDETGGDRQR